MDHLAIMNKSWKLIPKILNGQKTIESRWYKARFAPWDRVKKGDNVYFKNSGERVIAKANVEKVLQFEDLDLEKTEEIVREYGKRICLQDTNYKDWSKTKRYCILVFLRDPKPILIPFNIDKTGFGTGTAWISVDKIAKIRE